MNRLIKASSKVEVDPEAMEKLMVERLDFLHALENDIKPAFGTAAEALEHFLSRGIVNWGSPVSSLLEDGQLYIQQARATEASGKNILFPFFCLYHMYLFLNPKICKQSIFI